MDPESDSDPGDRRIVISRSYAFQVGDHNVQYNQLPTEPLPLAVAALDYGPVLADHRAEDFTGREWIIERIEQSLLRPDPAAGRYVLVEAGAGMGKTALAAELTRRWDCVHHFHRPGAGRPGSALRSLSAQLIMRYDLQETFAPQGDLPPWAGIPEYFATILAAAATRTGDRRLRIVVDSLDEALPSPLPPGVAVVATHRDGAATAGRLTDDERAATLTIEATDPANLEDLTGYIVRQAREETIAARLADAGIAEEEFVTLLAERSGGVWVYLRYALSQMRVGPWSKRHLETLPPGLAGYYRRQIADRRYEDDFHDRDLVLLATLAVAGQALTRDQMAQLTGIDGGTVRLLCDSRYRPFLRIHSHGPARYDIRHSSLREYLHGVTGADDDPDPFADELRAAIRRAHHRVADHYLNAFGGLADGLPDLAGRPDLADRDDRYPLRHLATHLSKGRRTADLHALLTCRRGDSLTSVWANTHDRAGTLDDFLVQLAMARAIVEPVTDAFVDAGRPAPDTVQAETEYALVAANVVSATNAVPVSLLAALVRTGVWDLPQALSHARRIPEPVKRAAALTALLPWLTSDPDHAAAVHLDARHAAALISDHQERLAALTRLLDHPTCADRDAVRDQAVAAATEALGERAFGTDLVGLAAHVPEIVVQGFIDAVATHGSAQTLAHTIADMLPFLSGPARAGALDRALRATSKPFMSDDWARFWVLAEVANSRTEPDRSRALDEVLDKTLALADKRAWDRDRALGLIAGHLGPARLDRVLRTLKASSCSALAAALDSPQRERVAEAVAAIPQPEERGRALVRLIPHLARPLRERAQGQALDAAAEVTDRAARVRLLAELVPLIDPPARTRALNEILAALRDPAVLTEEAGRAALLAEIAPHLGAAQVDQAVEILNGIELSWHLSTAVDGLAPRLDAARLRSALDAIRTGPDEVYRAALTAGTAPFLSADQLSRALELTAAMRQRGNPVAYIRAEMGGANVPPDNRRPITYDTSSAEGLEWPHVEALAGLAPYLDHNQVIRAVEIAAGLRDGEARVKALAALHAYRDTSEPALDAVTGLADEWPRVRALTALAVRLTHDKLDRALAVASDVTDHHLRAKALVGLAPHLEGRQLVQALRISCETTNKWSQLDAMVAIVPRLSEPVRSPAAQHLFDTVSALRQPAAWAFVLNEMAAFLSGSALEGAITAAYQLPEPQYRAETLARLADRLAGSSRAAVLEDALTAAASIDNAISRVPALAEVAGRLTGAARGRVIARAFDAAIGVAERSTLTLPSLVPLLDGVQLDRLLELAASLRDESNRANLLRAVAPRLAPAQLDRAVDIALALPAERGNDFQILHHEIGSSACLALYRRLGVLADVVPPGRSMRLVRRLYAAHPPRSLLLTVTGVVAPAIARAAGPESVARQFDTLIA